MFKKAESERMPVRKPWDHAIVVAFMDNILVETENEKKHDEIVEEVLRRIEENGLYIKPEKYVWKVKEINVMRALSRKKDVPHILNTQSKIPKHTME